MSTLRLKPGTKIDPSTIIGTHVPPDAPVTVSTADGRPMYPPDNSADIYAAINQTPAGVFISIWSLKAAVWLRLLNRYSSWAMARDYVDKFGFTYWDMAVPPHSRDKRHEARMNHQPYKGSK